MQIVNYHDFVPQSILQQAIHFIFVISFSGMASIHRRKSKIKDHPISCNNHQFPKSDEKDMYIQKIVRQVEEAWKAVI